MTEKHDTSPGIVPVHHRRVVTTLVKQRTDVDCGVACLAMATGRDYDDVVAAVGDAFDPNLGLEQEQKALTRLGFTFAYDKGEPVGDVVCLRRDWCISPAFFRRLLWGRRALVTVPSLNNVGGWHMVFFDGVWVHDPSLKKTYSEPSQLEPNELVLFNEVRLA